MSEAQIYTKDQTNILIGLSRRPEESGRGGGYLFKTNNMASKTISNLYSVGIWLTLRMQLNIFIPLFLPVKAGTLSNWWARQIPKYYNALGQKVPIEITDDTALNTIRAVICDTLTDFIVTPSEIPTDYPICPQNNFIYSSSSTSSTIGDFVSSASNRARNCISRTINADYIKPSDVLIFEAAKGPIIPLLGISKWATKPDATVEQTDLMLYVASYGGITPFQLLAIDPFQIQGIFITGWSELGELEPSIYL